MKQMTKEQAIKFYDSKIYEDMTFRQKAEFQIQQEKLCMPFGIFHEAVEKTIGRPVFTHEFGLNVDGIKHEIFDGAEPPTLEEIMKMLPQEKLIVISV